MGKSIVEDRVYYSDRHGVRRPRDQEDIGASFWGGFVALVRRLTIEGYLAESFPLECEDGVALVITGDQQALRLTMTAEIPSVSLEPERMPDTPSALDAVEFFARCVSKPMSRWPHSYWRHEHAGDFSRADGQAEYRQEVNRLFERCGHPYQLDAEGQVEHVTPPVLADILSARFHTGDDDLDRLLSIAVDKLRDPDAGVRAEALEKLWDAWERLKTLLPGDKRESVRALLDEAVAEGSLRAEVEAEAKALTAIGNNFMIRHSETDKIKIERPEHAEYLFHRLFALIFMVLRATGRASV